MPSIKMQQRVKIRVIRENDNFRLVIISVKLLFKNRFCILLAFERGIRKSRKSNRRTTDTVDIKKRVKYLFVVINLA